MKKGLLLVLAGALIGAGFAPALAADDEKTFTFNGEVRARYEYLNNYLDETSDSSSGPNDDGYSFAPYRVMLGITGSFAKNITAHADLQYIGFFGDEGSPQKDIFPPVGQFFTPYLFNTQGVQLYQGWVQMANIGGTDLGFRLGRQEHTYGTELFLGDNDYYAGLSFDGLRGMWHHGSNDLNFFYYKIAELNGPNPGPQGGANDSDLFGATYDWTFKKWGTVGGYVLIGQDLGGAGPVGFPDSKVNTYGVRWNRPMMDGDKLNMFDWDVEYAMQNGDAGGPFGGTKTTLGGWVGEGWFAFNFKAGNSHGRAHIGTLITSGDDTSTAKFEGFIPLYGDFHAHNRFGDLDWVDLFGAANITDFNVGYEHWFGDTHYVMAAWHTFKMTKSNGNPNDKLGDEIDLTYGYMYSKNLSFQVTLGQAMPGDAFGPNPDNVERITAQALLNW